MKKLLSVLIFSCLFTSIFSQAITDKATIPTWQIGVQLGANTYLGDLVPKKTGSTKDLAAIAAVNIYRNLSPKFAVRGGLMYAQLKGNDANFASPSWRQQRRFAFKATVIELSAVAQWNILGNKRTDLAKAHPFTPYVFGGLGLAFTNSKPNSTAYTNYNPTITANLVLDKATSLPKTNFVLPVGVGANYLVMNNMELIAEIGYRKSFTDYLDGFSKTASVDDKDGYMCYSIGLVFKLGTWKETRENY
jgi:opacity protein-like surface antigen